MSEALVGVGISAATVALVLTGKAAAVAFRRYQVGRMLAEVEAAAYRERKVGQGR